MLHCKPMWYYKTKHNHSILFLRCGALLNTLKGLRSLILHQALFFPPFSSLLKYLSVNFFIGYFWLCVSIKLKQSGQYRWLVGNRYLWPSLLKKKTKPHESQLGGSFPPWHFELAIWFFSVASTEIQQPEHFNSLWGSFFFFPYRYNRVRSPEKEKCCQLCSSCHPSRIWERRPSWGVHTSAAGYDYLQNSSLRARWSSRGWCLRSVPGGGLGTGSLPSRRSRHHRGSRRTGWAMGFGSCSTEKVAC